MKKFYSYASNFVIPVKTGIQRRVIKVWIPACAGMTVALGIPFLAFADVVINEIAWMGTANSASDEWIELYSVDSADLTGWHLVTEDGAMDIALSGSVTAGGFFLIERTDDTTVPNIPADLVAPFGSGLSNSGEILALKNAEGVVVDRIDASSGWPAGDNVSKDTMQKSALLVGGGWVTAPATPKAKNNTPQDPGESKIEHNTDSGSGGGITSGGADEPYVQPENLPRIKADAGEDRHAAVGEEIQFRGNAWGLHDEPLESARYLWNFGDGSIGEGQNVGHIYTFPGTYVVRLTISSGKYTAFDDLRVAVSENMIVVSEVKPGVAGWIEFENKGSETIHVGGWITETSSDRFLIPSGTAIAARSFVVLSSGTTGLILKEESDRVQLFYPNGLYASGVTYVFQVPEGKSVSSNSGTGVFTEPTPGAQNLMEFPASLPTERTSLSVAQKAAVAAPPVSKPAKAKKDTVPKMDRTLAPSEVTLHDVAKTDTPDSEAVSKTASLADAPVFSKRYRETMWFGGSLIAGGLLATTVVFLRRRNQKID